MNGAKVFFDTNVLLYLLSGDEAKAERAEETIAGVCKYSMNLRAWRGASSGCHGLKSEIYRLIYAQCARSGR